jgi:flagellar protein FliJ
MKKYEFKLNPVLKLRKIKEENCRMELGKLFMELEKIKNQIHFDKQNIDQYYQIQEGSLQAGMKATQLQAFPMLVSAKNKNLELLERDMAKIENLIVHKKQELSQLRGDLKVIENLKEKDYEMYRKALGKEIDQKVEEQTQNWLLTKENT